VPDTSETPFSLFTTFSFLHKESGLLLLPVGDVAMFKEVFHKINEKI
jgi:hypothetical protein